MNTYFVDEYSRQIDDKGRFILPSKLRDKMSGVVYITASQIDNCLYLYTEDEWNFICEKMRSLPTVTNRQAAIFIRSFFGTATCIEVDKQGRISIGKRLLSFANVERDLVLVGANTKIEIWAKEEWDKYNEKISKDVILKGIEDFGISL